MSTVRRPGAGTKRRNSGRWKRQKSSSSSGDRAQRTQSGARVSQASRRLIAPNLLQVRGGTGGWEAVALVRAGSARRREPLVLDGEAAWGRVRVPPPAHESRWTGGR